MNQKIRIKLKSFDHNLVDKSAEKIVKTVKSTGAVVSGPVPLPTHKQIFTVNRSTFVNKKAREQFQLCTFKRILDIYSSTPKTIDALMKLELPSGMVMDTGVTEEGTAFAFASADNLRLMLSAGESALLDGTLSEMTEEAQEAYRIYTDFDVEEMYLIDSELTEIGDQVFVMNSYYEETEESAVVLLNTVVDGISYSVGGYTVGGLPEDEDLEIIIAMAAALEVNE